MKKYIIHITNAGNTSEKLTVDIVVDVNAFEELSKVSLKICSAYFELGSNKKLWLHKTYKEGSGDIYYLCIGDDTEEYFGTIQFSYLRDVKKTRIKTLE